MLIGARQFFERRAAPTPPLPYDAEVEYLESTGTQYINTGFIPDSNTRVYLNGRPTVWSDNYGVAFGTDSGSFLNKAFTVTINGQNLSLFIGTVPVNVGYQLPQSMISIEVDNSTFTIDGSARSFTPVEFSATNPIFMFAWDRNGSPVVYGKWQIHSFQIYDSNVLARDAISVRKDGVGYMYDRVSGTLFGNAGTGAFTTGPDKTAWTNPYVTDGLVAMWDGEWNAGGGVHDPNATVWKELISGTDCAYSDANGTPNWVANGWESVVTDGKYFNAFYPAGLAEHHTLQFVVTKSTADYAYRGIICSAYSLMGGNNCGFEYRPSNTTNGIFRVYYSGSPGFATPAVWELGLPSAFSVMHDNSTYSILQGIDVAATETSVSNRLVQSPMRIGADQRAAQFTFGGVIHSIRFYNRALTAAEIAANYAIDKARFNLP